MGIKTIMITGDNPLTASAIAAEAGVDDFLAEATPEAKLTMIRDYQAHGHLNLPVNYVTEERVKLGMWLSSQRQAMRGNPNFLMTPERKALLDQIGMHWTLRRMNPNARRRP